MSLEGPQTVSLDISYHNEQQYTCKWLRDGDLNSF